MSKKCFRIEFAIGIPGRGPFEVIFAANAYEAKVLAQAERIKGGYDYEVDSVAEVFP